MNRRRSMLFASGKIPEGWYKPKDTPAGIFVCVYKNKQIYSIEASVFNADPSSFVDIIMGITVVTDKTRFIFSEKVLDYRTKVWDYGDVASPSLIQGVTAASNASGAVADYKGKENSEAIYAVLGSEGEAVAKCYEHVFLNGEKGFLPSAGQARVIYTNRASINALLANITGSRTIGGTIYYWTSTQVSASNAWRVRMSDGSASSGGKKTFNYYRAIMDYPEK
ncbi:hypothetical protein H8S77_14370 [Parabacteroides sp. BX2]|jgi:hypothetical protein|uniref:DUF1566 domain-containing protein n=1 Tax=Parabacteroides segnis TaxID=2763058 RepID=A0ABR7E2R9_9BACT|nr:MULTISPECIES: hypothetical protein [Parabacteroides]MBC5644065.1 hypothetical protein [Parabacteroides segnis]MCM0714231.1 DUF1566 domain-containing protein [Parabacteroides sp. TA-V-105]